jgi:hypothetical protein
MAKVRVKITPSLAGSLNSSGSHWLILEREIGEVSTIGDLFTELAFDYAEFRKVVFDPDIGKINDQIVVVLNDKLLNFPNIKESILNEGDTLVLVPMYAGG